MQRLRGGNVFMQGYGNNLLQHDDTAEHGSAAMAKRIGQLSGEQSAPIVFGGCFGWYHPGRGDLGVVLCGPHGYEDLCVHRHWRALAQNLAGQDLPTLRFDYPGTGDSAEDDESPDRVRAWIDSIQEAVLTLRRLAGIERVALVGLRMGALLATEADDAIADLTAFVLLAPIGSGETWVRGLRALAGMSVPPRHHRSLAVTDARVEAAGFLYSGQTIADLRRLPPLRPGRPPAPEILLLDRPHAVPDRTLHATLAGCGASVEIDIFHDYALLLRNADLSEYPHAGFDRVVRWLTARRQDRRERPPALTRLTVLRLPEAEEKPIFFNRSPDLFGVLCRPYTSARDVAVVILNTGSNHHIGTSRTSVTMARRLAKMGFASLRLDVSGIGDSDAGTTVDPTIDVSSALDGLRDRGYQTFILIGLCSGGKLALETPLRDDRVIGQILLNPQGYWKAPDATVGYMSRRAYVRMARQLGTWKRVVRGGVDIAGIARTMIHRNFAAAAHTVSEAWNKLRNRDSVRSTGIARFRALAARNVRTHFVFVEEDPGLDELEVVFGRGGHMLRQVPNVGMTILAEGDHTFSFNY